MPLLLFAAKAGDLERRKKEHCGNVEQLAAKARDLERRENEHCAKVGQSESQGRRFGEKR